MQLKYRGISYSPSAMNEADMATDKVGMYRGVSFRTGTPSAQSQPLGVRLSYRGSTYSG